MTVYLSEKIRIISFFSMMLVVILHSQLMSISSGVILKVQQLVTGELTRIAVPMFFMISGYLFFQHISKPLKTFFRYKIKKRLYSLFCPYLFWSIWGGLIYLLVNAYIENLNVVVDYNFGQILCAIFFDSIGAYQLWFLRNLLILVIFSPIIYWLVRTGGLFVLVGLFFFWVNGIQFLIQIESLFFFTIGAYIALKHCEFPCRVYSNSIVNVLLLTIWGGYCCFVVYYEWGYFFHCMGIILGIICFWRMYDCIKIQNSFLIKKCANYSFFIYVAHEPLLTGIKKSLLIVLGGSDSAIIIVYLAAPLITICTCILIGIFFKTKNPRFYAFISGGR